MKLRNYVNFLKIGKNIEKLILFNLKKFTIIRRNIIIINVFYDIMWFRKFAIFHTVSLVSLFDRPFK